MHEGKLSSAADCCDPKAARDPQVTRELHHLGRVVEELDGLCRGPERDALAELLERIQPIQRDQSPTAPDHPTPTTEKTEEQLVPLASQIRAIRRDIRSLIQYKSSLIDAIHEQRNRIEL